MSDIFGRRELLITALVFFTAGSVICGVACNIPVLLAGRCVQGVGGGGIITLVQVITADIIPLRQRPKFFSLVLAAWALGSVLGPFVGGLFVQKATWKWVFWVNLPFCSLGFIMVPLFVKLVTDRTSLKSKFLRVDWLGGFLFTGGLTSFLIGLSFGGVQFPWASPRTFIPIMTGILGVTAALIWERYGAREPFLRHSCFCSSSAIVAYLCAFIQGLVLFCALYYLPIYFLAVVFSTPIGAGVKLFSASSLMLPGSAMVSVLITRLARFRWAIWAGYFNATLGAGLLILGCSTATEHRSHWIPGCVVFGLGHGMILSSVNFCIQASVNPEDAGRAASMYAFIRTLGMAVGVAVGGAVFQNLMSGRLASLGLPTKIAKDAEGYIAVVKTLSTANPLKVGVLDGYVGGVKGVFEMLTAVSGVGLLISLFIRRQSMDHILASKYKLER